MTSQLFLRHAQFFSHRIIYPPQCKSIFLLLMSCSLEKDQLLAFYWCDIYSELLALSTSIPGHIVAISPNTKQ